MSEDTGIACRATAQNEAHTGGSQDVLHVSSPVALLPFPLWVREQSLLFSVWCSKFANWMDVKATVALAKGGLMTAG